MNRSVAQVGKARPESSFITLKDPGITLNRFAQCARLSLHGRFALAGGARLQARPQKVYPQRISIKHFDKIVAGNIGRNQAAFSRPREGGTDATHNASQPADVMFEFLQRILWRKAAMTAIVREMLLTALQHHRRGQSRRKRFRISTGGTLGAPDQHVTLRRE